MIDQSNSNMKRKGISLMKRNQKMSEVTSVIHSKKISLPGMVLLLAIVFMVSSCENKSELNETAGKPAKMVKVSEVQLHNANRELTYSGSVLPEKSVSLSFLLPGTLSELNAEDGQFVKQGTVIARIDNTSFKSAYTAALAAQKQVNDAHTRLKKVYENGSLPEIEWMDINTKLEQANSAVVMAKHKLDNCVLKAPISGYIAKLNTEVGQNVAPNFIIMQILDINKVNLRISVPENEINRIRISQEAQINIPAIKSATLSGRVNKMAMSADMVSKTYEVQLQLPNPDQVIKPGMICEVSLQSGNEEPVLLIPYGAIIKNAVDSTFVFVLNEKSGTVQKREVKTGGFYENSIEIKQGLKAGESVVTEGQHKIADRDKVNVLR